MKIISILLGIILVPLFVVCQTGRIEGTVRDGESGKPLLGVNVIVKHTVFGGVTNENGKYSINVPEGSYEIVASMVGYGSVSKEAHISAGDIFLINFELRISPIELAGIVVTGTRTPRYIKDSPVRTEIITAQRLKERGTSNLFEALDGFPGIRVEHQCSYCNYSVIRMQGLEPEHSQILIDGLPIYSDLRSVYGAEQMIVDDIDRIEIIKGAGSALYGSSAIAGVINIITKNPGENPYVRAGASFGTYNTNIYTLSAGKKFGNKDLLIHAQKHVCDAIDTGIGESAGLTDRVKRDYLHLSAKINVFNMLENDRLTFSGRALNEMRQGGNMDTWENPFAEDAEHIKTDRYEVGVGYQKKIKENNTIILNLGYSLHNRNASNDAFLVDYMESHDGEKPPADEMNPYLAEENLYILDMSYSYSLYHVLRLLFGAQYSYNILNESGKYIVFDRDSQRYGDSFLSQSEKSSHDLGIFLQGEFSILKDVIKFVLGGRYDMHRSKDNFGGTGKIAPIEPIVHTYNENALSPRMALMYRISSDFTIRSNVGAGFRVPFSFSEDLHLCSGSPKVSKPKGLKPEKSVSFNVGIDYLSETLMVNVNLFSTRLKDKIGFISAGEESAILGYTYEWANMDDAITKGIELGTRMFIVRSFSIDLSFVYTDAQYNNEREDWKKTKYREYSKYIPRVPEIAGNIGFRFASGAWNLTLNSNYTGKMYIDYYQDDEIATEIKRTNPFWLIHTRASRKFSGRGITIFAGAKNLLDYVQRDRRPDNAAFIYAPLVGRIIYGGFEFEI
jgi:outer membrane receptor for ferrienterochelin and colicins